MACRSSFKPLLQCLIRRKINCVQVKPVMSVLQHPLLCRPLVTTVRYCQSNDEVKEAKERLEGERGYKPIEVDWQTSIEYMDSKAYQEAYGDEPVWAPYRRNFKGQFPPETRKKCIRSGVISTGSACPVCRDDYLVLDYRNLKLLKQFIIEGTSETFPTKRTGICQQQQKKLELEIAKAVDYGYIETVLPFRQYDYDEYRKILAEKKQNEQQTSEP